MEAGRSAGGNSYGYCVVPNRNVSSGPDCGFRTIDPIEAAIVLRIFNEFAAGKSPRRIAADLNAAGIAGPRGTAWGPSTLHGNIERGTGILNNELYIGKLVWNRLRYLKAPNTGKRVSRLNPEDERVIKDVPDLIIVPMELWTAVKRRQQQLKKPTRPDCRDARPFWAQTRPKYLLSGLMKCGLCGSSFVKISKEHFGCAGAKNKGPAVFTNMLTIRRDTIEARILDSLQHQLMDSERFKSFAEEFFHE